MRRPGFSSPDAPSDPGGRRRLAKLLAAALALAAVGLVLAQVVLAAPPTADFTVNPTVLAAGQQGAFTATASDPDNVGISSYDWDFGDGSAHGSGATPAHAYASPGTYAVKLVVTDGSNETTTVNHSVRVNAPPTASFIASPQPGLVNQPITLASTSTDADGTITSYDWDFGDGSAHGSGQSPQHAYGSPGAYTVKLTVTDNDGATTSVTGTVNVNAPPTAAFSFSPSVPLVGNPVSFDASASTDDKTIPNSGYQWDFNNDGQFSDAVGKVVTHSFSSPGPQTVKLRITDSDGATNTTSMIVPVNAPPTAAFSFSPSVPLVGNPVSLDASASTDDKAIPSGNYAWDTNNDGVFGGTGDAAGGKTTSTSFASAGPKTVKLRVTDSDGVATVTTQTIPVNAPPTADFTINPTSPPPLTGQAITLDGSPSTDDKAIPSGNYTWDTNNDGVFGGTGDAAAGKTTTVSFATPGTKTIKLRVTDSDGVSRDSAAKTVRVNAPPVPAFSFTTHLPEAGQNAAVPLIGQQVDFDASASTDNEGPIAKYEWDFNNDGQYDATGKTATHAFSAAGDQQVTLRVTDSDGATTTKTLTVHVNTRPVADFVFTPETPRPGDAIQFYSTSRDADSTDLPGTNTLRHWEWDFNYDGKTFKPDSSATDNPNPVHTYPDSGTVSKTVALRVTDDGGAQSIIKTKTVAIVGNRPNAVFTFSPAAPLPGGGVTFTSASTAFSGEQVTNQEWDFDYHPGSFTADASGASVAHSFATPGPKVVALRVTQTDGVQAITQQTVVINAPPVASFDQSPSNPKTDGRVIFSSTSSDPDGPLSAQDWDLDNNGQFNDAHGAVASRTFSKPGSYTVRLRVTDSQGATTVATRTVVVTPALLADGVHWSISGRFGRKSTRINRLYIRAPKGALVVIRCKGRGCPRLTRYRARNSSLRLRRFERTLRSGTQILIYVSKPGYFGRYVQLTIKRNAPPTSRKLCLAPGKTKPIRCPRS